MMNIATRTPFSALEFAVAALCAAELPAQHLLPPPHGDLATRWAEGANFCEFRQFL